MFSRIQTSRFASSFPFRLPPCGLTEPGVERDSNSTGSMVTCGRNTEASFEKVGSSSREKGKVATKNDQMHEERAYQDKDAYVFHSRNLETIASKCI